MTCANQRGRGSLGNSIWSIRIIRKIVVRPWSFRDHPSIIVGLEMATRCPSCRSILADDSALHCFVCRRKLRRQGDVPLQLVIMASLAGVVLAIVFIVAQRLLATR